MKSEPTVLEKIVGMCDAIYLRRGVDSTQYQVVVCAIIISPTTPLFIFLFFLQV